MMWLRQRATPSGKMFLRLIKIPKCSIVQYEKNLSQGGDGRKTELAMDNGNQRTEKRASKLTLF